MAGYPLVAVSGARVLMREIDELLKRRPGLGTLVGEAEALRAQLAHERGSAVPAGASALTDAELRCVPCCARTCRSRRSPQSCSSPPHTIKSRMKSIYRKLDVTTRHQAVTRARECGLLEG